MIKLVTVAIVAGLFLGKSEQQANTTAASGKLPAVTAAVLTEREVLAVTATAASTQQTVTTKAAVASLLPVTPECPCCNHSTHIRCWTDWFDRDDPSGTGDWETFNNLRDENPQKICPDPAAIEATTKSGLSVAAAGENIYKNDKTVGFICRKKDQPDNKCNDYRVRFSCYPPFCGAGVCWTRWYDRDNPSGTGDWEYLSNLRKENPGQICANPLYIEAVTTNTNTPATSTGDNFFVYSPTQGLVCRNQDQKSRFCRDYKVRFGCPCES